MPTVSDRKTDTPPAVSEAQLYARARGAYLGLAIGDALGATVEFMTPREIRSRYGIHDRLIGGGWLRLKPGQVTDDTQMSLALGDAILAVGAVDARAAAEAFSDWMRSKPVDIGHTVRRGISHYRSSGETAVPYCDQGAGNGACMRCLPVALATLGQNREQVCEAVLAQAHVTHNNRLSDAGTLFVVEAVQAALSGARLAELAQRWDAFLDANPEFRPRHDRPRLNPDGYIVNTLQAVGQALFAARDFSGAMIDVVNRGGDADTTGAILGMIAGALWGVEGMPRSWRRHLDRQVARRCEAQAEALLALSLAR